MKHTEIVKKWKGRIHNAGYKLYEFAELMGIHKQVLSNYVTGRATPSLEVFIKVENKLAQLEESNSSNAECILGNILNSVEREYE